MLKFIPISVLALLLCSCAGDFERLRYKSDPNAQLRREQLAREREAKRIQEEADRKQWVETFEGTITTHGNKLIDIWGVPEMSRGPGGSFVYRWSKRQESHSGGYSVPDGKTEQRLYDKDGKFTGTIDTPKERYVPPSAEVRWCEIRVMTNAKGIITHVNYDGDDLPDRCRAYFPFPEGFPPK